MKFAVWVFRFFASLRLAIFLLLALALFFAVGTFLESAYGTEAAKLLAYRNPWMSLLLILLALNVAAAALDRLPWKKKHVGFVITHAGIILILAGALVTRAYGIEGQMAVQEGQTQGRIILGEPMLQVISEDASAVQTFPISPKAFAWKGRQALGPGLALLHYYPKASRVEKIETSSDGPTALHVVLESSFMKLDPWLVLDDPARSRIPLGPAELRFTREKIVPSAASGNDSFLEFQFKDSTVQLPVEPNLSKKAFLSGTPYQVTILRVLKDAVVEGNQLVDRSENWNNPAVELTLEGGGIQEKHTVFSQYPDFPTLHGMKPSQAGVRIFYHRGGPGEAKNELRFVWRTTGLPIYQVRSRAGVSEGEMHLGEEYKTGWMDFKFRVEQYYPHAAIRSEFHEEPVASQAEDHLSAVEIEIGNGPESKVLWLGQGDHEKVVVGGKSFQVVYGLRTQPIGFRLALRDFRLENYPGTQRPASFESDVTLKDDSNGMMKDLTIRMNEPLSYKGYRVFQSGYQQSGGEPEISIFTVARDPGIPLKYFGALVLIGGTLTMFYSSRFSGRPNKRIKEEAVLR